MTRRPDLDEFVDRARGESWHRQLDSAAAEAFDALERAGVDARLLKGPVIARLLYDRPEDRPYSDVDVLVQPGALDATRTVLAGLGYVDISDQFNREVAADLPQAIHAETWARGNEAGNWRSVMIDAHWHLEGCEADPSEAWPQLTADGLSFELSGRRIRSLNRAALAIHLATHLAQHGPSNAKASGDLTRGIARWPFEAWREAARLAERVQAVPAFGAGLRLHPGGRGLADRLELPQGGQRAWSIAHRDEGPRGAFHFEAVRQAPSARSKARLLRRALVPTREWIVVNYPWAARGPVWRLAAHAVHVARSPAWALRAWRFRRRAPRD